MSIKINSYSSVPDRAELARFLQGYYTNVLPKLAEAGGPAVGAKDLMIGLWDDIDDYLPPKGALVLAHVGIAVDHVTGNGALRLNLPVWSQCRFLLLDRER